MNDIKEIQKKIDKLQKKIVEDETLSKHEIEKLRELEEDMKTKIQQLRDSKDIPDSGFVGLYLFYTIHMIHFILVQNNVDKLFEKKKAAREYLKGSF